MKSRSLAAASSIAFAALFPTLQAATSYRVTTMIPNFLGTGFNPSGQVSGDTYPGAAAARIWDGSVLLALGVAGALIRRKRKPWNRIPHSNPQTS